MPFEQPEQGEYDLKAAYQRELEARVDNLAHALTVNGVMVDPNPLMDEGMLELYLRMYGDAVRFGLSLPREVKEWMASVQAENWEKILETLSEDIAKLAEHPESIGSIVADTPETEREVFFERLVMKRDEVESLSRMALLWLFEKRMKVTLANFDKLQDALSKFDRMLSDQGLGQGSAKAILGERMLLSDEAGGWTKNLPSSPRVEVIDAEKQEPNTSTIVDYLSFGREAEWVETYAAKNRPFLEKLVQIALDLKDADEQISGPAEAFFEKMRLRSLVEDADKPVKKEEDEGNLN